MPVANGMPSAAIGAREEVPPCCVTGISVHQRLHACAAMCQVAASATLCPTPRALCLDSEDATYMVALAAVR